MSTFVNIPLVSLEEIRNNPERYENQELKVRGFLYPFEEGYVIALEPNLKKCCIAHSERISLPVQGEFLSSSPSKAYSIQGVLKKENVWVLAQAKSVDERGFGLPMVLWTLPLIIIFFLIHRKINR